MQSILYTKKGEILSVQEAGYYMKTLENVDYIIDDSKHYMDVTAGHILKNKEDWEYVISQEGFSVQIEGVPENSRVEVIGQPETVKGGTFTLVVEEAGEYIINVFPDAKYLAKEIKVTFV